MPKKDLARAGIEVVDGRCIHFIDSQCDIYETRPDICRVDKMAEKHGVPLEEYHRLSEEACRKLKGANDE